MIPAIIDTSVLIRYLVKPSAAIKDLIEERWLGDELQMPTALALHAELKGVLRRNYIQALIRSEEEGQALLDVITHKADILRALWSETRTTSSQRTRTCLFSKWCEMSES